MRNGFRNILLVIACGVSVARAQDAASRIEAPPTRFVTDNNRLINATVELRSEATVYGSDVLFKQVARWSDADAAAIEPIAELPLTSLTEKKPFGTVTVQQIKSILHDAGVNEAMLRFTGATSCSVSRADVTFDEGEALKHWLKAKDNKSVDDLIAATSAPTEPASSETNTQPQPAQPEPKPATVKNITPRGLRAILIDDLATRLGQRVDDLQVTFDLTNDKLLGLSEPQFRFSFTPRKARSLGSVSWDVTIASDGGQHKAIVNATARLWQDQVQLLKPIETRQVYRPEDVTVRRVLIDQIPSDKLLTLKQVIGQEATRDLKPGEVVTARLVQAVPMVKVGQLVSVTLGQGAIRVKTVARAMEAGSYGQTIKVKNESTKEVYDVTVSGPQSGTVGDLPEEKLATAASNQ